MVRTLALALVGAGLLQPVLAGKAFLGCFKNIPPGGPVATVTSEAACDNLCANYSYQFYTTIKGGAKQCQCADKQPNGLGNWQDATSTTVCDVGDAYGYLRDAPYTHTGQCIDQPYFYSGAYSSSAGMFGGKGAYAAQTNPKQADTTAKCFDTCVASGFEYALYNAKPGNQMYCVCASGYQGASTACTGDTYYVYGRGGVPFATSASSTVASSSSVSASSSKPASSSTPASSSSSAAASTCTSVVRGAGDLQTFTGALGCISAPPVVVSGNRWTTDNQLFNFPSEATQRSCYVQLDSCQLAANRGGNKEPLTVSNCNQQVQQCLAAPTAATTTSSSSATSTSASSSASSSVASSATASTSITADATSSTAATSTATATATATSTPGTGGQESPSRPGTDGSAKPGGGTTTPEVVQPVEPAPSARRRRAPSRPQTVSEYHCMKGLTACSIPRTTEWECIDPMADIESCGGCAYGNFGGDTAPMGVDCTALPGVKSTGVTCRVGQCVITACKKGYTLMDGHCVPN